MNLEKIRYQIIQELQYNPYYKRLQDVKQQMKTLEQELNNLEDNLSNNHYYAKLKTVLATIQIQDEYTDNSNEILYSKQEIIDNIENFFTQNGNAPKDVSTIFEHLKTINDLKLPSGSNPKSAIGSIVRGSEKFNYNSEEKKWQLKFAIENETSNKIVRDKNTGRFVSIKK